MQRIFFFKCIQDLIFELPSNTFQQKCGYILTPSHGNRYDEITIKVMHFCGVQAALINASQRELITSLSVSPLFSVFLRRC